MANQRDPPATTNAGLRPAAAGSARLLLSHALSDHAPLQRSLDWLRETLELVLQARTGEPFAVLANAEGLEFDQHWPQAGRAPPGRCFLLPIITPAYFLSDRCRKEALLFLDYEAAAGRRDLVVPVYLVESDALEEPLLRREDALAEQLAARRLHDWRQAPFGRLEAMGPRLDELARDVGRALQRGLHLAQPPPPPPAPPAAAARPPAFPSGVSPREQALLRELTALRADLASQQQAWQDERRGLSSSQRVQDARLRRLRERERLLDLERERLSRQIDRLTDDGERKDRMIGRLQERKARLQARYEEARLDHARQRSTVAHAGPWPAPPPPSPLAMAAPIGQRSPTNWLPLAIMASVAFLLLLAVLLTWLWRAGDTAPPGDAGGTSEGSPPALHSESGVDDLGDSPGVGADPAPSGADADPAPPAVLTPTRAPFEPFRDCPVCPELLLLPGGPFIMGASSAQWGEVDERPIRHMVIEPFAIGSHEVTFAEWGQCVNEGGCDHRPDDGGWGRARRPVINVSWDDAQDYLTWLSWRSGEIYRLPSEAEWEYAARAGTSTLYWWGDAIDPAMANYGLRLGMTAEVGSYPANPWGLHEVAGNVLEWVIDSDYSPTREPSEDDIMRLIGETDTHLVRGGSWADLPGELRSTERVRAATDARSSLIGFRVARAISATDAAAPTP